MQLRMMVALVLPVMQHLLLLVMMMCCYPPTSTTVTGAEVPYYEDKDCPSTVNGTYAPNSTYHSNLAALAAELIRNSTVYGSAAGSAGTAPDVVYGVALCRGDSRGSYCAEHLGEVFDAVMNRSDTPRCVFHRNATVYYDRVQVRFADADFLSGYGNEPEGAWNNTNLVDAAVASAFRDHVAELMGAVAAAAASQPDRYGTGVSWFEAADGGKPVYGLAQCTRDMSPERCGGCLRRVVSEIPVKMNSSQKGGRILGVRCIIRYETDDKFFEMDNETLFFHMPKSNKKSKAWVWVIVVLVSTVVCVSACFVLPRELKKRRQRERARLELRRLSMAVQNVITLWRLEEGNSGFSLYDFSQIRAATDNFASGNKLGQGGFGSVYKGQLPNGSEVAAKRLAACSGQGLIEFKNEIQLVAKLQHRNLVRLLGCCIEGDQEKILVYEYMPNKSLDVFIFDNAKRELLDWPKRLHIIHGISQGLLYLHEHSTVCVVHRDLKASNVLLDAEMNAKISDFGIARIFGSNAAQSSTTRIVGTIGYIAPEYALDGVCSSKADVFSFGVLILEIISGKRTGGSYRYNDGKLYCLIAYAWLLWKDSRWHELIDECLGDRYYASIRTCMQVALLCVQEDAEDRKAMDEVVKMLSNEQAASLPEPKHSAYFNVRPSGGAGGDAPPSACNISISMITPR